MVNFSQNYQSPQWGAIPLCHFFLQGELYQSPQWGAILPSFYAISFSEYQSPQWGAIGCLRTTSCTDRVSIPAMGAIGRPHHGGISKGVSIPAMGGNSQSSNSNYPFGGYQSPRWGAIDQDYVGRFHYNRKRQLCQARPHLTCTNRTSLKERTCLIPNC